MGNIRVREILGAIHNREVIAEGSSVKIRKRLESSTDAATGRK